jgi:hypothetical protein
MVGKNRHFYYELSFFFFNQYLFNVWKYQTFYDKNIKYSKTIWNQIKTINYQNIHEKGWSKQVLQNNIHISQTFTNFSIGIGIGINWWNKLITGITKICPSWKSNKNKILLPLFQFNNSAEIHTLIEQVIADIKFIFQLQFLTLATNQLHLEINQITDKKLVMYHPPAKET